MTTPLSIAEQKKVLRVITRLKHSLAADREIAENLARMEELGTQGVVPRLETTLADVLGNSDSQ